MRALIARLFQRKPKLEPDLRGFNEALIRSVFKKEHDGAAVAGDFRSLFLREPILGERVLFMLLKWCGEYDQPPESNDGLQRWAGRREVAARIKAAMYADLSSPIKIKDTK